MKIKVKQNDIFIIFAGLMFIIILLAFNQIYSFTTKIAGPYGHDIIFYTLILFVISSVNINGYWSAMKWWLRSILLLLTAIFSCAILAFNGEYGGGIIGETVVRHTVHLLINNGYIYKNATYYIDYINYFYMSFTLVLTSFTVLMFRK